MEQGEGKGMDRCHFYSQRGAACRLWILYCIDVFVSSHGCRASDIDQGVAVLDRLSLPSPVTLTENSIVIISDDLYYLLEIYKLYHQHNLF